MVLYMSPMRANGGANLYHIFYSNTFAVRNKPCTLPTIYGKNPHLIRYSYINSSLISGVPRMVLYTPQRAPMGGPIYITYFIQILLIRETHHAPFPLYMVRNPRPIRHSYINSSLISGAPRITLFRALWRASGGGGSVCRVKSIRMTYVC